MSILTHSDLDLKKINYKKPEKQGIIYYSGIDYQNSPFYLQTPRMKLTPSGLAKELMNSLSFLDNFLAIDREKPYTNEEKIAFRLGTKVLFIISDS